MVGKRKVYGSRVCRARWTLPWLVGVAALGGQAALAADDVMSPGKYKAPLKYAVRLPPYCGADYFGYTGPQYQRPSRELCGVRTNHFCGGLISMMMARDEPNRVKKRNHYLRAEMRFRITQDGIQSYPQCPMRADLDAAQAQLRVELGRLR